MSGNGGDGIHLQDTSVATLDSSVQITGNAGWGIYCAGSPSVAMITGGNPSPSGNGVGQNNCSHA